MKDYKNCSMTDCAFDVLSNVKGEISFKELFDEVCKLQEISDDKKEDLIADLFTLLNLDGRFAVLKNNMVDLRSRRTYDEIKVDMQSLYDIEESVDSESEDEDSDEDEDSKILNGDDESDEEDDNSSKESY